MKKINRTILESEKDPNKKVVIYIHEDYNKHELFVKDFMEILQEGFKIFIEELEFDEDKSSE